MLNSPPLLTDDDKAELEEELESLLKEAEPDALSYLPEVPTGGLRPSLPLPLEEDLSRLTLSDSGWYSCVFVGFFLPLARQRCDVEAALCSEQEAPTRRGARRSCC